MRVNDELGQRKESLFVCIYVCSLDISRFLKIFEEFQNILVESTLLSIIYCQFNFKKKIKIILSCEMKQQFKIHAGLMS